MKLFIWAVLFAAVNLAGCANAPGLFFGAADAAGSKGVLETWLGRADPQPEVQPQPTPPGVLKAITPELIQSLQRSASDEDTRSALRPLLGQAAPYTIGVGDQVHINVWGRPELVLPPAGSSINGTESGGQSGVGNAFNVSPDGHIQFPLIGTLSIVGLTENQARLALVSALKKYIVDPQVTLRIQAYRAGRVYLDGEVRLPGLQAINDVPMTLPEALSRAGGLTATADRSQLFVTRDGATTPVNLQRLAQLGINPAQILLKPNDVVRVASQADAKVYVMGEVVRQTALTLRNGRLSLNEALGESGGVNPGSGNPRQIFVIRSKAGGAPAKSVPTASEPLPEIFHLDARSPMGYALAEGFELKARDVVYVDPVPLVRWNRVISLILPSAQAVTATRSAIN